MRELGSADVGSDPRGGTSRLVIPPRCLHSTAAMAAGLRHAKRRIDRCADLDQRDLKSEFGSTLTNELPSRILFAPTGQGTGGESSTK